jgi:hypothetical protein
LATKYGSWVNVPVRVEVVYTGLVQAPPPTGLGGDEEVGEGEAEAEDEADGEALADRLAVGLARLRWVADGDADVGIEASVGWPTSSGRADAAPSAVPCPGTVAVVAFSEAAPVVTECPPSSSAKPTAASPPTSKTASRAAARRVRLDGDFRCRGGRGGGGSGGSGDDGGPGMPTPPCGGLAPG